LLLREFCVPWSLLKADRQVLVVLGIVLNAQGFHLLGSEVTKYNFHTHTVHLDIIKDVSFTN
jgi:hypothetical protein